MSDPDQLYAHDLVIRSAKVALGFQAADGSMPAGHNGPHRQPETPVRNTGHWLITWCFAARMTGDDRFRDAASMAADYLLRRDLRPGGFTYHHRSAPGKDRCNGLMGPAFSIESLVEAGRDLARPDLTDLACQLIDMHPYDPERHLWQVRETDGNLLGSDPTLNHQIWFASAVSQLDAGHRSRYQANLQAFCDNLKRTMGLRRDGRICHLARNLSPVARFRQAVAESRLKLGAHTHAQLTYREQAYHLFNLFPLALMKRNGVASSFWESRKFAAACRYARSGDYTRIVEDDNFVQPWIPAGFPLSYAERALVNDVFDVPDKRMQSDLMEQQFKRTYNPQSSLLDLGTVDPTTQAARIYEITRLPTITIRPLRAGLPQGWLP